METPCNITGLRLQLLRVSAEVGMPSVHMYTEELCPKRITTCTLILRRTTQSRPAALVCLTRARGGTKLHPLFKRGRSLSSPSRLRRPLVPPELLPRCHVRLKQVSACAENTRFSLVILHFVVLQVGQYLQLVGLFPFRRVEVVLVDAPLAQELPELGTSFLRVAFLRFDGVGVRGVSWSEVATVPKRKSHRGLDLDLSLNSEVNIWKGWKENGGMK